MGSHPVAGDVGDLPLQSEGGRQRRLRPHQLEHGLHRHQDLPGPDGERSAGLRGSRRFQESLVS